MSKITYANKVAINENAEIPNINKVTDNDMNEIKTVVNNNDDELITINTELTNATTYSTTETVVGTWTDGKPIYRKIIIENVSNGVSSSDISNLNIKEIYYYTSVCYRKGQYNNDYEAPYYIGQDDYFRIFFRTNNISSDYPTSIQYRIASSYPSFKIKTTIYYTKTTD